YSSRMRPHPRRYDGKDRDPECGTQRCEQAVRKAEEEQDDGKRRDESGRADQHDGDGDESRREMDDPSGVLLEHRFSATTEKRERDNGTQRDERREQRAATRAEVPSLSEEEREERVERNGEE